MDTRGAAKARRGRELSPHASQNSPQEPVHENPFPEANSGISHLQYAQLLQQVQALTAAVQGLQHSVLHTPPTPPADLPPPAGPTLTPPLNEDQQREERSAPHRPSSPGLGAESSCYHKSLPSTEVEGTNLLRKVDDMGRQLEALKIRSSRSYEVEFNADPPFSPAIMSEAPPPKFRMPQAEFYDGTSDPLDHIESFKALMLLHGATDGILCRAFPATLRKAARLWFSGLRPNSIHSFEQLGRLFIAHFISSRRQRRGSDALIGIKQKEGESLRDFIRRFNTATLEVTDLDQTVAMTAMKGGLRPSRFLFSLEKRFPADYAEMLSRADKYANAEEAMASRKEPAAPRPDRGGKRRRDEPADRDRPVRLRGQFQPRFEEYTPLAVPQSQVLMEVKDRGYFTEPPKMRTPVEKRDKRKYCRFHRDYGHDTDECFTLKDEIEALIRKGRLSRYVEKGAKQPKPAEEKGDQSTPDNQPTAGVISMISGGKAPASAARKSRCILSQPTLSRVGWTRSSTT